MVGYVKSLRVSTPIAGAGLALAAGLMLGAAMRPQLAIGELSPQPIGAWADDAAGAGYEDPSLQDGLAFAQYSGKLPDYVVGADWLRLIAPPAEAGAPIADATLPEPAAADEADPLAAPSDEPALAAEARATPAAAQAPVAAGAEGPQHANEPGAVPTLAIDDHEPLPEATGDTTVAP